MGEYIVESVFELYRFESAYSMRTNVYFALLYCRSGGLLITGWNKVRPRIEIIFD
jgi:hypothetical protein